MPAALCWRIARSPLDSLALRSMLLPMLCSTVSPPDDMALCEHDPTSCLVAMQPLSPGAAYTLSFLPSRLQCLVS